MIETITRFLILDFILNQRAKYFVFFWECDVNELKPCLVLGTGFHHWVLGDSMSGTFAPLTNWDALLLEVASSLGVALERSNRDLSLKWEQLLIRAIEEGMVEQGPWGKGDRPTVSTIERWAKRQAAKCLALSKDLYPIHSKRARFPLSDAWGSIISLNFDAHWLTESKPKWSHHHGEESSTIPLVIKRPVMKNELLRLNNHIRLQSNDSAKRLWFPNGFIGQYQSLRLGLREFGFQPTAIQHAFSEIKAFEREAGRFEKRIESVAAALNGEKSIAASEHLPITWVTEMLYRPVIFAGAGMSDAELGLWWIMVQRARNLVNVPIENRPRAYILLQSGDDRANFWKKRPCGIEPIFCPTWEEGWQTIEELGRGKSIFHFHG